LAEGRNTLFSARQHVEDSRPTFETEALGIREALFVYGFAGKNVSAKGVLARFLLYRRSRAVTLFPGAKAAVAGLLLALPLRGQGDYGDEGMRVARKIIIVGVAILGLIVVAIIVITIISVEVANFRAKRYVRAFYTPEEFRQIRQMKGMGADGLQVLSGSLRDAHHVKGLKDAIGDHRMAMAKAAAVHVNYTTIWRHHRAQLERYGPNIWSDMKDVLPPRLWHDIVAESGSAWGPMQSRPIYEYLNWATLSSIVDQKVAEYRNPDIRYDVYNASEDLNQRPREAWAKVHEELLARREKIERAYRKWKQEIETLNPRTPVNLPNARRGIGLAEFWGGLGMAGLLGYRWLIGMPLPWVQVLVAGSVALAGGVLFLDRLFNRRPTPPAIEAADRSPALIAA